MSCFCLIWTPADTHNTPPPPHTHKRTHARTHTRSHTRTGTHTHTYTHTRQISNRLNDILRCLTSHKFLHTDTHTHTHTHTQTYTVHTNTQPPHSYACMCVHELVCVRVWLGVCYLCVCLLVYVAEARDCPCNLGIKPFETRHLLPYNVRCGKLSYLWSDHCLVRCLSIKNYSTESGFFFWYQFTPRKLLYDMILVNLVKFGLLGLSGCFGATLYKGKAPVSDGSRYLVSDQFSTRPYIFKVEHHLKTKQNIYTHW